MPAAAANGVNFVDENQARGVLAGLFEHIAHAAGADAHKHFDEVRPADAEKGGISFTGDGFGQQGFAGSRRADH